MFQIMHILLHKGGFINSKSNNIDFQCDTKTGDHCNPAYKAICTAAEAGGNGNTWQEFLPKSHIYEQ